ncbi:MAG: hypothetical protein ACYTGV_01735 [Planctomycetota bacterium]|jgi:hypothetical protein
MRTLVLPLLAALAAFSPACRREPDPVGVAKAECKAYYDVLYRWISTRGSIPDTQENLAAAARVKGPDPWGNAYVIDVEGSQVTVVSFGPDGVEDTPDDIWYPE